MSEDEAFIRAIADSPGDGTARLVYADWLDDRSDPRGAYLRAEIEWARTRKKLKALRALIAGLNPVWTYRVSRPPVGVCFSHAVFEPDSRGPALTLPQIEKAESRFGGFPPEYTAFLLNYNGGELIDSVDGDDDDWSLEGFAGLDGAATSISELVSNIEFEYEEDGLQQSFTSLPRGHIPFAFSICYGIGTYYNVALLAKQQSKKGLQFPVVYFEHPLANDIPIDEAQDASECFHRISPSLTAFLHEIDNCFGEDEME